jgi:dTDP-4-dehydrorhamnose reductase
MCLKIVSRTIKLNILLTGAAGQLGNELLPLLSKRGNVTATDLAVPSASSTRWVKLDISDAGKLDNLLNQVRPELIVNTAAFTAVDAAETAREIAFEVNAALPERLANWSKQNHARLIHYSTDYIFNGESTMPYLETDLPDPQNVYGESKLEGERVIQVSGCRHAILRTSWVYSSHGKNFVLSMLELARKGLSLSIVDDQRGCPTWARNLALASENVIESWQSSVSGKPDGVFHYCDDRDLSWYDFALAIFRMAVKEGLLEKEPDLTPVSSAGFPQPATRPKWSVLNTSRIAKVFNIQPASFEQSLQAVIGEVQQAYK